MSNFKLAKKDAVSDTRTNIYDLHEKKLEYFESEKKKLPEYISVLGSEKNPLKVAELKEKIYNIENDIDLHEYLLDFFQTINTTTSDKEKIYEEPTQKGVMDSFCVSKINTSKIETYNTYIQKFNPELKEIDVHTPQSKVCERCTSKSFMHDFKTSTYVCTMCGMSLDNLYNDEMTPVYTENTEQVVFFNYKRNNHFQECLNQLQAKENTTIPSHIIKDLKTEFKKYNITNPKLFTNTLIKSYLKKLKYNKYYEHIPTIINEICGLPAPKLTHDLEQQLKIMFDEIQTPFEKYSKIICPFRKNFLNYNYIFYKMCQLLGKDEFLLFFPLLKNRERLYEHDLIWKGICVDLHWEFIASI
jgi:hypothetical protein